VANWDVLKWLEALAYLIAVLGGISGACLFLFRLRKQHITFTFNTIARAWTNEGDISATDTFYVTLELADMDGDLVGSLSSNAHDGVLEAHAYVGWFNTKLVVTELRGRHLLSVGTVRLKLSGNNNRLQWHCKSQSDAHLLPQRTVLWPSVVGVAR
jgi:hypothetical protein